MVTDLRVRLARLPALGPPMTSRTKSKGYSVTPNGRYFVVRSRLWRRSNLALDGEGRQRLGKDLMTRGERFKRQKLRHGFVKIHEPPWQLEKHIGFGMHSD